jgi:hypothetical protein
MTEAELKVAESDVVEDIPMIEATTPREAEAPLFTVKQSTKEEREGIEEGEAEDTMDTT